MPRLAAIAGACACTLALGPGAPAGARSASSAQQSLSSQQSVADQLRADLRSFSGRLGALQHSIDALQARLDGAQAAIDRQRAQLVAVQTRLHAERAQLNLLVAREARGERVLAEHLVRSYEQDRPDLVTVVLEAHGFADLLERIRFMRDVEKQDVQITTDVRNERRAVAAEADRLGRLEVREQRLTAGLLAKRNEIATVKVHLDERRLVLAQARDRKAARLADINSQVRALQAQLNRAQPRSVASGPSFSGPIRTGSAGGFTFPMPISAACAPSTWTQDQGVDICAPGHTPLLAVGSGTIVLHGIGGFGPSAPVLHLDSGRYVYYGHAGPGNMLPIGTHVSAGQVISEVGAGIVGISSGPHLEIGFSDSSGTPIGGTSGEMLALLHASY
jgi:murein DD-endopeptidase MepM/ murein hydrolase activator NlpD